MRRFSTRNIILVWVIVSVAVGLSVLSFQYSSSARSQILDIASQEARSNAEIQAHDLSAALANKVESVSSNLELMSGAPLIQEQNVERAVPLFTAGRESTAGFASSYFWIDAEGKLLWADAFVDPEIERQYVGADRSNRDYYIQPRDTLMPYHSTVIESIDSIPRLYIGHPIIGGADGRFKGVVAASIDLDTLGKFVEEQLVSDFPSSTGLLDKNGRVLYSSSSPQHIGKNILDPELQSILPLEIKDSFNQFVLNALEGNAGSRDFTLEGSTSTIAYKPVTVHGSDFAILFIITPHELAASVVSLVEQQQSLNFAIIVAIGAVAASTAVIVLTWNRRLSNLVNAKTSELKFANESLVESNRQLQVANASLADANQQLSEANEELKVHGKMQNEFVNVAAHELRTPVQPVLGIVEGLEDKLAEGENETIITRPEIEMLARNARRLVRLTYDVLEVSRIEANALKLKKEPVELQEKIREVMTDVKVFIDKGKELDIVLEGPKDGDHFVVEADKGRLFEVLSNLITNAIKFTDKGRVSVSIERENGHVKISVKDTGRGIEQEIFPSLFTKFATKSETGTGLGLYIAKSIVEAHGGRIWAENNADGRGATFTFTLPLETIEKVEAE